MSSIPGWGTKIPHIEEQLSTCTTTKTPETKYINIYFFKGGRGSTYIRKGTFWEVSNKLLQAPKSDHIFWPSLVVRESSKQNFIWVQNQGFLKKKEGRDGHHSICLYLSIYLSGGFPGGASGKNPPANGGNSRCGFNPWVGKIPWRRAWQPTPVFLLEEFQRQRSLVHRVTNSWTRLKQLSMYVCRRLSVYLSICHLPSTFLHLEGSTSTWFGGHS